MIQKKMLSGIQLVAACFIIIWLINPIAENIVLLAISVFLWCGITILTDRNLFFNIYFSSPVLASWLFIILKFFYSIMDHCSFALSDVLYLFCFGIGSYYVYKRDIKSSGIIVLTGLVYFIVIGVNTLIAYIRYPSISRILSYGDESLIIKQGGGEFISPFIADHTVVYGLVLIIIPLVLGLKSESKIISRICMPLIALFSILILKSQFFIAIVMLIFVFLISWVRTKDKRDRVILVSVTIFVLIIIYMSAPSILHYLSEQSWVSNNISYRLNEISEMIENNQIIEGGDTYYRTERYMLSINSFFDHPFIGVGNIGTVHIQYGDHSTFFDTFAIYGIFGGFLCLLYYYAPFALLKKITSKDEYSMISLSCLFLLIMAIVNRANTRVNYAVLYTLIPLSVQILCFKNNETAE